MKKGSWRNVTLAHGPMQRWFTKTHKKCHMLPAKSLCSAVSTLQPRKEQVKRIQGPAPLGKAGLRADPSSHHRQQASSPLQCKVLESRNCPHPVHQHVPQTKITRHTGATLLVEWQMNFMEGCGGTHCGNRRKKEAKIYCIIRLFKSGGRKKGCPPWGMKAFNQIRTH